MGEEGVRLYVCGNLGCYNFGHDNLRCLCGNHRRGCLSRFYRDMGCMFSPISAQLR